MVATTVTARVAVSNTGSDCDVLSIGRDCDCTRLIFDSSPVMVAQGYVVLRHSKVAVRLCSRLVDLGLENLMGKLGTPASL